jgi:nicotinate-nucleotide adenylyltransferase
LDLRSVETMVSGVLTKTIMINTPWVGISSTELRRRVARGVSIRYWVPESVEAYIRQHGLYHGDQWEGKV